MFVYIEHIKLSNLDLKKTKNSGYFTWENTDPLLMRVPHLLGSTRGSSAVSFLSEERGNTNNGLGLATLLQSVLTLHISHELCDVGS